MPPKPSPLSIPFSAQKLSKVSKAPTPFSAHTLSKFVVRDMVGRVNDLGTAKQGRPAVEGGSEVSRGLAGSTVFTGAASVAEVVSTILALALAGVNSEEDSLKPISLD